MFQLQFTTLVEEKETVSVDAGTPLGVQLPATFALPAPEADQVYAVKITPADCCYYL